MQANERDAPVDYLTQVAEFAAQTPAEALPRPVREKTALILADSIGAMAGGAVEPDVVALRNRPNLESDGPALLIGTRRHVARANAALLNGTAGTTLEMDEGNQFAKGHPGVHTVPAALAAVAEIGRPVSGSEFLAALTMGYEIGARVGIAARLRPGMHPHGVWGAICSTVAVLRLMQVDATQMRQGLNIAASFGLTTSRRSMLEGGTVRNVYAGVSGQLGLLAADMVAAGFSGDSDGVGHVFSQVASDAFAPDEMTRALGERWEISRNYFKMHSCCRFNHAALDALEMIRAEAPTFEPAQVASVEVESYAFAAELDDPAPRSVLAGKFSLPFAMATALVNGTSGVDSFTQDKVDDPAIRALAAKVRVTEDPTMTARLPDKRPARVTVTLEDGRAFNAETATNRGDWADPYTPDELRGKYLSLTARAWDDAGAAGLWDEMLALDAADDVAVLLRHLAEAAR